MEGSDDQSMRKGLWTVEEDKILMDYIKVHGKGKWNRVAKITGLKRCGKSCRLRWMNYLSPNVKRGDFSQEEDDLIIRLHNLLGNRWSLIAGRVPGRTDNQVKNHWNTHLSKRLGVKKEHMSKPKHYFKQLKDKKIKKVQFDSNSVPSPNTVASEEASVKETDQTLVEVTGAGEQRIGMESCENSFWFFGEDLLNFETSFNNFNELVDDEKYVGFGWEGL
ncbi:hypothetical protein ACFE04_027484 [Oxalis oulophora]